MSRLTGHELECLDRLGPLLMDLLRVSQDGSYRELPQAVWSVVDRVDREQIAERIRLYFAVYYSGQAIVPGGEAVEVMVWPAEWGQVRHQSPAAGYLYVLTRTYAVSHDDVWPPYYFTVDVANRRLTHVAAL